MTGLVAVLGAGGAVGGHTARLLAELGVDRLRLGARRPCPGDLPAAETVAVDLWDDAGLAAFCAGASVVVNCAGPSYAVVDRVALAARAAGANYVDPGGDVPLARALSANGGPGVAVLNAGLMPGLTAVLPRWLARGMGECRTLTAHIGLLDRMTPVGAAEYLLTLSGEHGEALAAWRDGARRSRALEPASGATVPFFPGPVELQPYLSLETERLAASLRLSSVDWWNVFDGTGHVLRALGRLRGATGDGTGDIESAARQLCAAADLDLFGRTPYQILVFRLDGPGQSHTAVLRGTDTYALTAAVAAFATRRVLHGAVPPGVHYVEDAVPADALCDWLRTRPEVTVLDRVGSTDDGDDLEEGAL